MDVYNAEICEANGWDYYINKTTQPALYANRVADDHWPMWAKALKLARTDADTGVGDTVARLLGDEFSDKYKAWYKATFGKYCRCNN